MLISDLPPVPDLIPRRLPGRRGSLGLKTGIIMMNGPIGKRPRSPSVPFIGLLTATERARQLHDRAKQDPLAVSDVSGIWGLTPKSSAALQTVAALLAYDLAQTSKRGYARDSRTRRIYPTRSRHPRQG
jgi:hypothetical protein